MKVSKLGAIYLLIFFFGFIARYIVGISSDSQDLLYYLGGGGYQITYLGFQKNLLLFPLYFFEEGNIRIFVLAAFMSLFNLLAIITLTGSRQGLNNKELFISSLMSIFFIQIDMHLIRQQLALYIFIISIYSNSRLKYLGYIASVLYHEAFLLFLFSFIISGSFSKKFLFNSNYDILLSILIIVPFYIITGDLSLILLTAILLTTFIVYQSEPKPKIFIFVPLLVTFILHIIEFTFPVNILRLIGVITSYCMFMMIFDRRWGILQTQFKMLLKFTSLLSYSIYYASTI